MHFQLPSIAAILAVTGLVGATPLLNRRQTTTAPPARYYLQTKVIGSTQDSGSSKDGLWVYSYHTGAGLGDVGLSPNKTSAWEGYLNGTQQLFTYTDAPFPWPLDVKYGSYQGWFLTTISVADEPLPDAPGFFFNSTGLQWSGPNAGWLACDWWHGVPQLFSLADYSYGPISSSCSKVELYPVAV